MVLREGWQLTAADSRDPCGAAAGHRDIASIGQGWDVQGIDGTVPQLADGDTDVGKNAVVLLGRFLNTEEHIPKVTTALRSGLLTRAEYTDICTRALQLPLRPEPIPPRQPIPCFPITIPNPSTTTGTASPVFREWTPDTDQSV